MSGAINPIPSIAGVPSLSTIERASILDALFEPCTALHTLSLDLLHTTAFESYNDLIASVGVQLIELSESALQREEVDSLQSKAEQAQLNTGPTEEAEKLKALNREYEETFPGLRYVVFVNGRSRPVIFEDMQRRISRGDIDLERREAIQAMCDIAADRASKLQTRKAV
ncbi:hypothetical protein DID88_001426 [Monilinia fructigena]|uniref:Oxo-4-hydroxy-4-carboxy-5-ureidoimidazoline decarboxylase domain-containing protein n=1 Tax=Monilinia fructigena TaxID=38457 RepID=A0A395IX11_9HELO|nr:hypothetical protein DID88_001426 [Monilinia fructigena]